MRGFRSWIALGCAVVWSGAVLAQDAPEGSQDGKAPQGLEVFFRDDAGNDLKTTQAKGREDVLRYVDQYQLQVAPPETPQKLVQDIFMSGGGSGSQWPLFFRGIPNDQGLGASFEPADESLRSQLDVPAGQGLVVTSVAPGGPAARIGILANDILLSLGDKPLGKADDLAKALKSIGEDPVSLKLLRAGKPVTVRARPEHHVTLAPVATTRSRYVLGVQVIPLEGALRSHLEIPDKQGLLVSVVEEGSAAKKAGLKKNDILVSIGDKPLAGSDDLVARVQDSGGKPIALKVVRSGKPQTVEVAPTERTETIEVTLTVPDRTVFTAVRPTRSLNWVHPPQLPGSPSRPLNLRLDGVTGSSDPRLNDLLREVKELRRAVDELQKSVKSSERGR